MADVTSRPVRVRFAPSPTGYLHIGGARTALLNWLFARHSGGKFILRIEDTDQVRFVKDAVDNLMESMRWLGLDWDEGPDVGGDYGPYVQSGRLELYQKWAHWLVEQGKAYRCYATPEELAHAKEQAKQERGGKIMGYERIHRFISEAERAQLQAERGHYAIRFATPLEGQTIVHDRVRGQIVFDNTSLSDAVLLKSDGFPTYHLGVVVDDHFMNISHVMRSDEWIPSFGLHHNLYQAFGWDAPEWVHLPVILNPSGKGKISKRKPPVDDEGHPIPVMVHEYREQGYLPDALVNFLTNIGYNFGDDQEIFTPAETIARFTLDRINNAGAKFPMSKLKWLNGEYVQGLDDETFIMTLSRHLEKVYGAIDPHKLAILAPELKKRANPLSKAVPFVKFLYAYEPCAPAELIQKQMDAAHTKEILRRSYATIDALADFNVAVLDTAIRALVEDMGLKVGQVLGTLRQAITAQQVSPPLWESMLALGKEESLKRIQAAETRL